MKLIIASSNAHKLVEIREILGGHFEEIVSLREAGIDHETVESTVFTPSSRHFLMMKSISASVSVGKRFTATTHGR